MSPKRLPELRFPSLSGDTPIPLRPPGRQGAVLLLLHTASCRECIAYLESLAEVRDQLADWDGRVLAVVPEDGDATPTGLVDRALPFLLARDEGGRCASSCDLPPGSLVIADQWGEVFHIHRGRPEEHGFPGPEEVVEWLKFVAIQCPECQGEAL